MNPIRKIRHAIENPTDVPTYVLAKLLRKQYHPSNVKETNGQITFDFGGFVNANSRPELLARHNYEMLCILDIFRDVDAERSLEIGCGYGRLSPIIGQFATENIAIDINEESLAEARKHYPDIEFKCQSAMNLELEDDSVDLIVTWTVLQHIPPSDIQRAVDEIKRVSTEQATILICEATRYPDRAGGHTWDRPVTQYEELFADFNLVHSSPLSDVDRIPEMESPGQVMLFQ